MATVGQLIKLIANATGLPDATVAIRLRHLREAGVVSNAGQGFGAAHVTPHDCAAVLIAAVASKDSVGSPGIASQFLKMPGRLLIPPSGLSNSTNKYVSELRRAMGEKNLTLGRMLACSLSLQAIGRLFAQPKTFGTTFPSPLSQKLQQPFFELTFMSPFPAAVVWYGGGARFCEGYGFGSLRNEDLRLFTDVMSLHDSKVALSKNQSPYVISTQRVNLRVLSRVAEALEPSR